MMITLSWNLLLIPVTLVKTAVMNLENCCRNSKTWMMENKLKRRDQPSEDS